MYLIRFSLYFAANRLRINPHCTGDKYLISFEREIYTYIYFCYVTISFFIIENNALLC